MAHELFMKLIKEEIETGTNQQVPKIELVENALHQLSIVDKKEFNDLIEKYRERKNGIIKEQIELNEKLNKIVDTYYNALIEGL